MSIILGCSLALVAGLSMAPSVAAGADRIASAQATGKVSSADAAPFIGDWTLALEGPNGPGTFTLSVKTDQETVSAVLVTEATGTQAITDITKADTALSLSYSFTWEGNPVDAVIRLTPAPEGKMKAQIDFAGGAYVMTGSATKKEAK
jgi:hypothetical protein